jgi:energy-coupling factor transporter transmembrane protein EcfT
VVPLVLSSIVDVEQRAIALEARAFNRPVTKTSFRTLVDSQAQRLVRWILLPVTLAAPVGRLFWEVLT